MGGKLFVDLSTNKTYRWSGTTFIATPDSIALGETSSTAYAGNKGKANAVAIANILNGTTTVPKATDSETVNGKTVLSNVPENAKFTDTTYSVATQSKNGLMSKEDKVKLDGLQNVSYGTDAKLFFKVV